LVDALLEVVVLPSVLLLEVLQVIELILESVDLILELHDFSLAFEQLGLLRLQVARLGVKQLVQVLNSGHQLRDFELKTSGLRRQLG
jgi:hypothetical protein